MDRATNTWATLVVGAFQVNKNYYWALLSAGTNRLSFKDRTRKCFVSERGRLGGAVRYLSWRHHAGWSIDHCVGGEMFRGARGQLTAPQTPAGTYLNKPAGKEPGPRGRSYRLRGAGRPQGASLRTPPVLYTIPPLPLPVWGRRLRNSIRIRRTVEMPMSRDVAPPICRRRPSYVVPDNCLIYDLQLGSYNPLTRFRFVRDEQHVRGCPPPPVV